MGLIKGIQTFVRGFFPIKDIQTALEVRPAVSRELIELTELWYNCYIGEAPWLGQDIDGSITESLRLEQSVVRELANVVTNEMTAEISDDQLREQFSYMLYMLPSELQKGLATGAMVIKPTGRGGGVQFVPQSEFIPVEYDSRRRLKDVIFPEIKKIGDRWYTRLEFHRIVRKADGTSSLVITNRAFRSPQENVLGAEISLKDVDEWAEIEPEIEFPTDRPIFGYYRNPLPNTIDPSPAGISVFDAALSMISMADRQFSRLDYEFDSARRRIIADVQGVKNVNGRTVMGADLFTPVDIEELFKDFTPTIRQSDFAAGLNEYKREIEFQCGLSYGDISDPQAVDKTATEIRAAKQRKYNTVTAIQKSLKACIEDYAYALAFWEAKATSGYTVTCNFKDSILTDEQTERQQDLQDVSIGAMGLLEYRMKWYGEDEKTAAANLPEAAEVME